MQNIFNLKFNRITWIVLLRQEKLQDATFVYISHIQTLQEILNNPATDEQTKESIEKEIQECEKTFISMVLAMADKYFSKKDYDNAALCYCELFKYIPDNPTLLLNFSSCLEALHQIDLQAELLEHLQTVMPFNESDLYFKMSENFLNANNLEKAIEYREKHLLAKKKIYADDYNNLGDLYNRLYCENTGKVSLALKSHDCFKRASNMYPDNRLFAKNATIMAGKANQFEDYKFFWDRMLKINDMTNDDKFDYACFCLKSGDLPNWYKYSEARFKKENNATYLPKISKTRWYGTEDISNSTLLVHYEQGFGDSILFSGYLNQLKSKAKHIIFVVQNELTELMQRNFPDIEVFGQSNVNIAKLNYDYYIPAMSIPGALNLDIEHISVGEGYLKADENLVNLFKEKYFNNKKLKIGVAFSGSNNGNKTRDIPIEAFLPLDKFDNVELYCITKGLSDNTFKNFKPNKVHNIGNTFENFDETAAAMANCDLIITGDNVILNLAGALGKKTFGLFNWSYEFRWFNLKGKNVGWYSSVKPFVNEKMNDWLPTVKKVSAEVLKLL